jgi:hypothetical protein
LKEKPGNALATAEINRQKDAITGNAGSYIFDVYRRADQQMRGCLGRFSSRRFAFPMAKTATTHHFFVFGI